MMRNTTRAVLRCNVGRRGMSALNKLIDISEQKLDGFIRYYGILPEVEVTNIYSNGTTPVLALTESVVCVLLFKGLNPWGHQTVDTYLLR